MVIWKRIRNDGVSYINHIVTDIAIANIVSNTTFMPNFIIFISKIAAIIATIIPIIPNSILFLSCKAVTILLYNLKRLITKMVQ